MWVHAYPKLKTENIAPHFAQLTKQRYYPHTIPSKDTIHNMEAADPLSCVYKKALESYEELHRQRKLKPEQLALIKGQASISSVLQDISRTKVKYESERSAVSKLVHKITPAYIDKLDRASKIVEVAIQSSKYHSIATYITIMATCVF